MYRNPHDTRCLRTSELNHGVRRHSSRNDTRIVIASRAVYGEAISTFDRGDRFAHARGDKIRVTGSRAVPSHKLTFFGGKWDTSSIQFPDCEINH
jgi:hypothetical protein